MPETTEALSPAWRLVSLDCVNSTNDIAAQLPSWHVVLAKRQLKGRGRYRRSWVSDEGGLWLSAVLPTPGAAETWAVLPLAVGWALRQAIESFGITGLHLRWPNDLLCGRAKLAGILVERFSPETAVVGIGINYSNSPALQQPDLTGLVTRLLDLATPAPGRDELLASVLAHLTRAQELLASGRVAELLPSLNEAWKIDRVQVALEHGARHLVGTFCGVDTQGNLLVNEENGIPHCLPATEVEWLRELL